MLSSPGVEVEPGLDDPARLVEVVVRLLDRRTFGISASSRDRLRLDVDHDAGRDVVDDDRLVADLRDRLEVLDDAALRRLVVVRRDDEEARRRRARAPARSGAPSARSSTCRCRRSTVARPPTSSTAAAKSSTASRRRSASATRRSCPRRRGRRSRSSTRWRASSPERCRGRPRRPSRNGVTTAVRTSPSTPRFYSCSSASSPTVSPGGSVRQPLEREQHAGDERLARARVVTDRQRLTLTAEDDLLVRDEPGGAPSGWDVAAHQLGRRLRGAGRRVALRVVRGARRSPRSASAWRPPQRSASSGRRRARSSAHGRARALALAPPRRAASSPLPSCRRRKERRPRAHARRSPPLHPAS